MRMHDHDPWADAEPVAGAVGRPADIHPTAVVEEGATIAADVRVGPYCVISGQAVIGRGTVLANHVTVSGSVRIGERNRIFANCVIGGEPQDVSYRGTDILANGTLLGGHVRVHSRASLSGIVAVHHWATIGGWSFTAGLSRVLHDVPPFMLCEGLPARPRCINVVALKRGGFAQSAIEAISEAYRLLYRAKVSVEPAREILRSQGMLQPHVVELLDFLDQQQQGRHGRARERRRAA